MKHYVTIIQDEASFEIFEAENEAQEAAKQVIEEYESRFEAAKRVAYDRFPTKVSFSQRTVQNEAEFRAEFERLIEGFSYNNENGVQTWETPTSVLVAKYINSPCDYLRRFEFEVFERL